MAPPVCLLKNLWFDEFLVKLFVLYYSFCVILQHNHNYEYAKLQNRNEITKQFHYLFTTNT